MSKESNSNVGDLCSIPGLGRSPGEGNGYLLQYSGLENSMDGGAWQATVRGLAKSQTRLSDFHFSLSTDTQNFIRMKNFRSAKDNAKRMRR